MRPHTKVVAALGFLLAVVATPREAFWAYAGFATVVVALARLGHVPLAVLARRLAIEVPFVVFVVALPFVAGGDRTHVLGVSLSVSGLWAAWNVLAKATIGIATSIVLTATTPLPELIRGLDRLRVPAVFTAVASFMIRYLDVVADELRRLQVARISRGDDPRWLWQVRAVATSIGALFIRSYERGERVHLAMVSRGYDGQLPATSAAASGPEWTVALALPLLAAVVAVTAWLA